MPSMNSYTGLGHLTAQPTLRQTKNGNTMATFTLAVSTGKDSTMFLDCTTFGNDAEYIDGTEKGALVAVDGWLTQDNWEDKNGNKRSKIKCRCRNVGFCRNANQHGAPESTEQEQGEDAKQGQIADDASTNEDDIPF